MGFNTFPCNPYPISTEELYKGNNDDLNTRVAALESDVSDLNSNKANQITIAPFFSEETAYTAGDLVYYNGLSYRCTNDHEGAWDADDFAATTISNELDSLKSGLNDLIPASIPVSDVVACWKYKLANNFNFIMFVFEKNIQDSDIINGHTIISGLPHARADIYTTVGTDRGVTIPVIVTATGNLIVHYPSGSYSGTYRIDATICYYAMD